MLGLFITPYLEKKDNIDQTIMKFILATHAWNTAIISELSVEDFKRAKEKIENFRIKPYLSLIQIELEGLVKRKKDKFAEFNDIIVDFEIKK